MAQLNWLEYLQKNQWKPSPLPTIADLEKGRQEVRDVRRIRAIEEAKAKGLNAEGGYDPNLVAKSLIESGYGENVDEVQNIISEQRAKASETRRTEMVQDASLVTAGLMSPEMYNRKWYNQQIVQEVPEQKIDTSWMKGIQEDNQQNIPQSRAQQQIQQKLQQSNSEILVPGKVGEFRSDYDMSLIQPKERKIVETPSQMSPRYLSETGDVRRSIYTPIQTGEGDIRTGSGISFSTSGLDDLSKNAYKNYLARKGIDTTNGNLDEQISQRMAQVAREIPVPILTIDPKDPQKSINEYRIATNEYPAKVIKAQNAELELLRNVPGTYQSEEFARTGEKRAIAGESRAEAGERRAEFAQAVSTDPLTPSKNPILSRNVTPTELGKIQDYRKAYENYQNATKSFEDALDAAIAKAKIDGSVNWDNVVSNLVAMGSWPSSDAVSLKQNLDPNVPVTKMGLLYATDKIKGTLGTNFQPRGASQDWVKKNVAELNNALTDAGGKPFTARDQVEAKRSPESKSSNTKSETAAEKRKRLMGTK